MAGRRGAEGQRQKLLKAVPKEGSISNSKLRTKVGFSERTYWLRRDELVTAGELALGRGQGGTVYRVDPHAARDRKAERNYYQDLEKAIRGEWKGKYSDMIVEVTAHGGSKNTGGSWTRPDLTLVGISGGTILPPYVFLDVHTFEVKRVQDADVKAVHEALRHRLAATHAWVVIVVPTVAHLRNLWFQDRLERIGQESAVHGLGLVLWRVDGRPRWDVRVPAVRAQPDPKQMDAFLSGQLSTQAVKKLKEWFGDGDEEDEEDEKDEEWEDEDS